MTTIIARNRELVGDRRKLINARKLGVVGVRDEAKIHKTPFCFYGISGWEVDDNLKIGMPKFKMLRRLSVLFTLSYIASDDEEKDRYLLENLGWDKRVYELFKEAMGDMRNLMGNAFAHELNEFGQHLVAMGQYETIHIQGKEFLALPNFDTVILGAGDKMAAVLLDNGLSYDEIYHTLRTHAIPTGIKYDVLNVDRDLPKMIPNFSDSMFIKVMVLLFNKALAREKKQNIIKDAQHEIDARYVMAARMAVFMAMGKIVRGKWKFNRNIPDVFSFKDPISFKNKFYREACEMLKIIPEENPLWKEVEVGKK